MFPHIYIFFSSHFWTLDKIVVVEFLLFSTNYVWPWIFCMQGNFPDFQCTWEPPPVPKWLIYYWTSELQLHPCSPILPWLWVFLGRGDCSSIALGCSLALNIQYQEKRKLMISYIYLKKKKILFPLELVQLCVSVGPTEHLSFSPGYSVPLNIPTCISGTSLLSPKVQLTDLYK